MASTEFPAWIDSATAAAVRLAAEAGTEVDDILEHVAGAPADRVAFQVTRLEQSADLTEVATDLAGLLWAECEDVPLIATILEEPATQAALQAVAEARRQAAQRLADAAAARRSNGEARPTASAASPAAAATASAALPAVEPVTDATDATDATDDAGVAGPPAAAEADAFPGLTPLPPLTPLPDPAPAFRRTFPPVAKLAKAAKPARVLMPATSPDAPAPAAPEPALREAARPPRPAPPLRPAAAAVQATGGLHPAAGAVLAGTAAVAIMLFGRRLRRA